MKHHTQIRKKAIRVFFVLSATLCFLATACVGHCGWFQEHIRDKPALQMQIQFAQGFSLTNSFSVTYSRYYWVEIVCPRSDSTRPHLHEVFSTLSKELPITFTITCDGVVVAEGDSTGEKSRAASAAEDTRIITNFKGVPGKRYELTFHTLDSVPVLDATRPSIRISTLKWADSNLFHLLF